MPYFSLHLAPLVHWVYAPCATVEEEAAMVVGVPFMGGSSTSVPWGRDLLQLEGMDC